MLKWLHKGYLEFSEQLDIIDWIGKKYLLIEKITFTSMSNICFHDAQISWNNIFSVSPQGNSLTINILILMKKDEALNLSIFQKILYELLSYYANYLWLWFYIHNEAAVLSFPSNSCSEHFWKYQWWSTYFSKGTFFVK